MRGTHIASQTSRGWLTVADHAWCDLLSGIPHDPHHLPEYAALCAAVDGLEPIAFYAQNRDAFMIVPLLIRRLSDDLYDAESPYGYASPLIDGAADAARELVDTFVAACRERSIVAAFLRLHPLLNVRTEEFEHLDVALLGETIYIDLHRGPRYNHGHRSDLHRLKRDNFSVIFDDWSRLDDFARVYAETMARTRAAARYCFSEEYFDGLASLKAAHLAVTIAPNGQIAAAAVFLERDGIVQYHLAGTATEFRRLSPSKLLIDRGCGWAQARGNRYVHLGGGVGASTSDALFAFKAGFSRLRAPYRVVRAVVMPTEYAQLCAGAPKTSYFPRYRAVTHDPLRNTSLSLPRPQNLAAEPARLDEPCYVGLNPER